MIAGGSSYYDDPVEMTEVIELVKTNSTPSFGQLPSRRFSAVGAMFGNAPILCGGWGGDMLSCYDSCISFLNSQWSQSHSMKQKRSYPVGVQINSTTFWILGGYYRSGSNDVNHDSTEFIIEGQTNAVSGPKLPLALSKMCVVKLSDEEIFVIGGWDGNIERNEVWIYNPQNGFARNQGPSLKNRRNAHACSTMRDGEKTFIIVAGGWNGAARMEMDSVEIYNPTDNAWNSGKTFPPPQPKIKSFIYLHISISNPK